MANAENIKKAPLRQGKNGSTKLRIFAYANQTIDNIEEGTNFLRLLLKNFKDEKDLSRTQKAAAKGLTRKKEETFKSWGANRHILDVLIILSKKEKEVFINSALGFSYKEIAKSFNKSENTIKSSVLRIKNKGVWTQKKIIREAFIKRDDIYFLLKKYLIFTK